MVNLLQELRREPTSQLYLLSNLDEPSFRYLEKTYPDFFALFDGITISALVHMIKPYENIYQHVLDTYHLEPGKTLFLDDQPENVATAQKMGLKAIHYTSARQAIHIAQEHLRAIQSL